MKSPPPSTATPRTDRATLAGGVVRTARVLGFDLLDWQRLMLERALEVEGGRPAYRSVDLSVGRQNGKSVLLWCAMTHRLLSPGQVVTYTAQSRMMARERLLERWWPRLRGSPLGPLFRVSRATGGEALRCSNGSMLLLLSGDEASGHGESITMSVIDEAWALTGDTEAAVRPAMAAKSAAQMWVASCAGSERSSWWHGRVQAGRLAVATGLNEACFIEWAASPSDEPGDPATWRRCVPGLGALIDEATIRADMAAMPPALFKRSYLNLQPHEAAEDWAVIPEEDWSAVEDPS